MSQKNIAIIGNGVYGHALGFLFSQKHRVMIFGRTVKHPGERLLESFGKDGEYFDYVILSITTSALSDVYPYIAPKIHLDTRIIVAMKGLTAEGLLPIDECRRYTPDHDISILSGPGFAEEIMAGAPVHLVLAGTSFDEDEEGDFLLDRLTLDFSHDIIGVSWCGVLKNIYAIGAGRASLIPGFDRAHYTSEVVNEMEVLLDHLGGMSETAHGPAGRGDVWICTTPHSRNFRYGAGDEAIRDQAEGHNASLQVALQFGEMIASGNFPILNSILSQ